MLLRAAVTLLCLSAPLVAHADIPPPEGYVETCSVEEMEREGADCSQCSGGYNLPACAEMERNKGRQRCCNTYGGSFWEEVWCEGACPSQRPTQGNGAASEPATTPAAEDDERCSCRAAGVPRTSSGSGWLLFAPGLLVLRRRFR